MSNNKTRNSGIDCLKVIMCFVVILCHCWDCGQSFVLSVKIFHPMLNLAVPVFFLMSSILCGHLFSPSQSEKKFFDRMEKLAFPHFFWAIAGFILLLFASGITGSKKISLADLLWQLLAGHVYDRAMWFQVDLMILTIWFYLTAKLSHGEVILYALIIIAFLLQYTGTNYSIFCNFCNELKYTLGRIIEMVPYFATGIIMSKKQILGNLEKHRWVVSLICISIIAFHYLSGNKFNDQSFQYAGLGLYFTSISTVILFWIIPFEKLHSSVKKTLQTLSGFTLGVYCMHSLIPELGIAKGNLPECLLIFIICLAISFLISMMPFSKIKMAVK